MLSRIGWLLAGAAVLTALTGLSLFVADSAAGFREDPALLTETPAAILFAGVGALILSRTPAHRIGWLCLAIGLSYAVTRLTSEYAIRATLVTHDGLPLATAAALLSTEIGALVWPMGALLLLWFPSGRPASRRWGYVGIAAVSAGLAYGLLVGFVRPYLETDAGVRLGPNPFALGGLPATLPQAGFNLAFGFLLVTATSLVWRLRSATGAIRQQLKILVYVCALIVCVGLLIVPIYESNPRPQDALTIVETVLWYAITSLVILGVPVAIGTAILRYRLYDIDIVISRTLLFGSLALFITGVYVSVVVGVAQLLHAGSQDSLPLSILATTVVAIAFDPVRRRLQAAANRIVYGHRASPYEVLAQFASRVSGMYSGEHALSRTARVLSEGLAASTAIVFIRQGDDLHSAACWPPSAATAESIPLHGGRLAERAGLDRVVEVRHRGELLGALGVAKPRGESLSPVEDRLLNDLAAQAGAVLHNVRLNAALQDRLNELSRQEAELRRSRERLVAAQDAERRRLERNIHDGAQQHLVALAVKIRLAKSLCERDPDKARELIADLRNEVAVAQDTVRDLGRGIYPTSLRDNGLVAALRTEAVTLGLDIDLTVGQLRRHDEEIEAGAYFCCLEALQNTAKHAPRAHVKLNLDDSDGELAFRVVDDGPGFDPARVEAGSGLGNMRDRAAALGGHLTIDSTPGHGVEVSGRLPIQAGVAV